jgi:hypothetical protein
MTDISEIERHKSTGKSLLTVAVILLILGALIELLPNPNTQWAILLAIIAAVVGNSAFKHLELAFQLKPEPPASPIIHDLELLSSSLKNGRQVHVTVQIQYPSEQNAPYILTRINLKLQRSLNEYLSNIEALSSNPYTEIDQLFQRDIEPLRQELNLDRISIETISVQGQTSPPGKSLGIKFGGS